MVELGKSQLAANFIRNYMAHLNGWDGQRLILAYIGEALFVRDHARAEENWVGAIL